MWLLKEKIQLIIIIIKQISRELKWICRDRSQYFHSVSLIFTPVSGPYSFAKPTLPCTLINSAELCIPFSSERWILIPGKGKVDLEMITDLLSAELVLSSMEDMQPRLVDKMASEQWQEDVLERSLDLQFLCLVFVLVTACQLAKDSSFLIFIFHLHGTSIIQS